MKTSRTSLLWAAIVAVGLLGAATPLAFAKEPKNNAGWPAGNPADAEMPPMPPMMDGEEGDFPPMPPGAPMPPMPPRGPHGGPEGAFHLLDRPGVAEKLGLTEEQAAAIKSARDAAKQESKEVREALKEKKDALHELLTGDADPQLDEVLELHAAISMMESDLGRRRLENVVAIRALLTDEQEAKIREFAEGFQAGRRHGEGGGEFLRRRVRTAADGESASPEDMAKMELEAARQLHQRGGGWRQGGRNLGGRPGFNPEELAEHQQKMAEELRQALGKADGARGEAIRARVEARLEAAMARLEQQQQLIEEITSIIEETREGEPAENK